MTKLESNSEAAVAATNQRPWYRNRWLIGGIAAVALYVPLGFLLVPYLVRHYVPKVAVQQFQRQASIGEVRFNPFLFKFEAKDFALNERDGAPILGLQRLFVDFELESMFRWAWTFADIRLEGPTVNLVIGEDDRLNIAKVLEALPESKAQEPADKGPPPRLLIKHVAIGAGKVTFTDRSNPTPATAVLEPIQLELGEISTLPEHSGPYRVTAELAGGVTLEWQGEVSLQPIASSGTLQIDGFRPTTAWEFVQDRIRLTEPAGQVDVAITYQFGYAAGATTLVADPINIAIKGVALTEAGTTAPMLQLETVELPTARFDLAARELVIPSLLIRNGRASARVDADGTVNWATLVKSPPAKETPAETAPPVASAAAPWKVRVESFKLDSVALDYRDASRALPVTIAAGALTLALAAAAEIGGDAPQLKVENLSGGLAQVSWTETSGGEPLVTLKSLAVEGGRVDLGPREIRLDRVTLTDGAAQIKRAADGTIRQLTAFGPGEGKISREIQAEGEAAAAEGQPWKFALGELALRGFAIGLSDEGTQPPVQYDLEQIDVVFKDVSNDGKTPLKVDAKLGVKQGGTLSATGTVGANGETAEAEFMLAHLTLKPLAPLVAKFAALTLESGDISGTAKVSYRAGEGGPSVKATGGVSVGDLLLKQAESRGVALTEAGATAPMLQLETVELTTARFDLVARELVIPSLSIRNGRASARVDADGTVNWATLVKAPPAKETPAETAPPVASAAAPWKVRVESFKLDSVALDYRDASRALPVTIAAGALTLALAAAAEIGGDAPQLKVENLSGGLAQVSWTETWGGEPLVTLKSLAVEGGRVDLGPREIRLDRVTLTDGAAQIKRAADGTIRQLTAFGPGEGKISREIQAAGEAAAAEGQPWKFALGELALRGFAIGLSDEGTQPPVQYDLEQIDVVFKDVSNDGKTPLKVDAKLGVKQGGTLSATGTVGANGETAEAEFMLARLTLKPLAPLVAKFVALTLESGDISGTTKVSYRAGEGGPSVKATGGVSVGDLLLQDEEAESRERLLSWKELSANGIDFSLGPDKLFIREVRLLEPGTKIVIFKDRSVNLVKVLKRDETPETQAPAGQASGGGAASFPVAVERVRVENATVDFADLSLVFPFATQIQQFKGAATGISSDPKSRASLKFEGRVGEFGDAAVEGSLAPFAPKEFTDIGVMFRNLALTPLSPYTATFAGRKIASGKLDLDLQYKIDKSELLGQNKVLLREFTLGEKVKSEKAVNLPLDLAVSLLTDSAGKIDLAIPVSGNLDNPEFSFGGAIRQTLGNFITKIATAPFRVLGAALGGDAKNLGAIGFEPGRAELAPPEQKKLKKVTAALAKRPQLKVTVYGTFDPAADGVALKDRNLRLALAQKLGVRLAPGEDPGPVAYEDAKTQRALEALLEERGGDKALADFQAAFEKRAGRPAKRVNPALALFGQGSEDRDFYAALFAHLVETAPKPDAELQALAENRAAEVARVLTTVAGLEAARVAVGKTGTAEKKDKTVPSKLELEPLKSGDLGARTGAAYVGQGRVLSAVSQKVTRARSAAQVSNCSFGNGWVPS